MARNGRGQKMGWSTLFRPEIVTFPISFFILYLLTKFQPKRTKIAKSFHIGKNGCAKKGSGRNRNCIPLNSHSWVVQHMWVASSHLLWFRLSSREVEKFLTIFFCHTFLAKFQQKIETIQQYDQQRHFVVQKRLFWGSKKEQKNAKIKFWLKCTFYNFFGKSSAKNNAKIKNTTKKCIFWHYLSL